MRTITLFLTQCLYSFPIPALYRVVYIQGLLWCLAHRWSVISAIKISWYKTIARQPEPYGFSSIESCCNIQLVHLLLLMIYGCHAKLNNSMYTKLGADNGFPVFSDLYDIHFQQSHEKFTLWRTNYLYTFNCTSSSSTAFFCTSLFTTVQVSITINKQENLAYATLCIRYMLKSKIIHLFIQVLYIFREPWWHKWSRRCIHRFNKPFNLNT